MLTQKSPISLQLSNIGEKQRKLQHNMHRIFLRNSVFFLSFLNLIYILIKYELENFRSPDLSDSNKPSNMKVQTEYALKLTKKGMKIENF
jgi:hypothetical protein